jgi:GlcNAc-P-P-Und epimerase
MKGILLTGGSGFIGRYFHHVLDQENLTNFDLQEPNFKYKNTYIKGDLRNCDDINKATSKNIHLIIHLGACHFDFQKNYEKHNVVGTKNLVLAAEKNNINKIVFFSSVAVYGAKAYAINEDEEPMPETEYGVSKLKAENILREWAYENNKRSLLIIRPTVVYGPYNFGNVVNLIKQIDNNLFVRVGKGNNIKSVVYVENLVNTTIILFEKLECGVKVYNLVDTPNYSVNNLISIISNCLNTKVRFALPKYIIKFALLPFEIVFRITGRFKSYSFERLEKFTASTHFHPRNLENKGIKQKHTTEIGIQNTIKWYKNSNYKDLKEDWVRRVSKYN